MIELCDDYSSSSHIPREMIWIITRGDRFNTDDSPSIPNVYRMYT